MECLPSNVGSDGIHRPLTALGSIPSHNDQLAVHITTPHAHTPHYYMYTTQPHAVTAHIQGPSPLKLTVTVLASDATDWYTAVMVIVYVPFMPSRSVMSNDLVPSETFTII